MFDSSNGQPIFSMSWNRPLLQTKVEGLGQIDKGNVEGHLLFAAFLLQLAQGEKHVDGTRGTLALPAFAMCSG